MIQSYDPSRGNALGIYWGLIGVWIRLRRNSAGPCGWNREQQRICLTVYAFAEQASNGEVGLVLRTWTVFLRELLSAWGIAGDARVSAPV